VALQGENLLIPIHAYPIMNETKFPKRVDFGKVGSLLPGAKVPISGAVQRGLGPCLGSCLGLKNPPFACCGMCRDPATLVCVCVCVQGPCHPWFLPQPYLLASPGYTLYLCSLWS